MIMEQLKYFLSYFEKQRSWGSYPYMIEKQVKNTEAVISAALILFNLCILTYSLD